MSHAERQFPSKAAELLHLLGQVSNEMALLSESSHIIYMNRRQAQPQPISDCRYNLHGLRGQRVVADFATVAEHCARVAVLLAEVEAEEEGAVAAASSSCL